MLKSKNRLYLNNAVTLIVTFWPLSTPHVIEHVGAAVVAKASLAYLPSVYSRLTVRLQYNLHCFIGPPPRRL